jgi:glucose/arabinose dehydrogenase
MSTSRHAQATLMAGMFALACGPNPSPPQRNGRRVEVIASNLVVPWSLAIAPDERVFVAERPGRIRVIRHDTLANDVWATIPVVDGTPHNWETGLMGLALHPDFARNPYVFVCYTVPTTTGFVNRVARLRERDGHGDSLSILVDDIPAGWYHNGCRVKVGPDEKLYVTTGDSYRELPAQNQSSLAGKVLRLNLDGSVPSDNPIAGSPVWSLGHRNPQGIAWNPATGTAYLTEHGSGIDDEINVLRRGANYGWPDARGQAADPRFVDPAFVFHRAPTGATFIPRGAADNRWDMLVTTLSGYLMRFSVDGQAVSLADDSVLVGYGRLRDVVVGPRGSVYVSTSNRDGRARPRRGDDRVLRIWMNGPTP